MKLKKSDGRDSQRAARLKVKQREIERGERVGAERCWVGDEGAVIYR